MRNIGLLGLAIIGISFGMAYAERANALIEVRASYGLDTVSPSDLNNAQSGSGIPAIGALTGFGIDAIVSPPLFPIGFGARYESMGQTVSAAGISLGVNYTRLSVLLDYRVIDTLIYLGGIGSFGLSHTSTVTASNLTLTAGSTSSYTVGIEGGVHLIGFLVGGEIGYQSLVSNSYTASTGGAPYSGKVDLSGTYAKLLVGFGF